MIIYLHNKKVKYRHRNTETQNDNYKGIFGGRRAPAFIQRGALDERRKSLFLTLFPPLCGGNNPDAPRPHHIICIPKSAG
jgi:hypothetical protein